MSRGQGSKRNALKVLKPDILRSKSKNNSNTNKKSVSAFVQRQIMANAREISRKNRRARKLGIPIEEYPSIDPIWRVYQNSSVRIEDFDLTSCENDDMLFEFGKEIVEQLEAAEIAPDDGIPIDSSLTLPRSFLLDAIHLSASMYCIHLQRQTGKAFQRSDCPAPFERAKLLEGYGERYISTIKTLFRKTKNKWDAVSNGSKSTESSDEEATDIEPEPSISEKSTVNPDVPDFDAIMKRILDIPEMLEDVPAYEFDDCNEFGADGLWTFDTSSLLAFGVLAEEFISSMIDSHLEYNAALEEAGDEDDESDSVSEVSHISTDISGSSSSDISDEESIDQ